MLASLLMLCMCLLCVCLCACAFGGKFVGQVCGVWSYNDVISTRWAIHQT